MLYGYIIITYLIILLIGFAVGRRVGIKEGQNKAIEQLPIGLKLKYYSNKKCPICLNNESNRDFKHTYEEV